MVRDGCGTTHNEAASTHQWAISCQNVNERTAPFTALFAAPTGIRQLVRLGQELAQDVQVDPSNQAVGLDLGRTEADPFDDLREPG